MSWMGQVPHHSWTLHGFDLVEEGHEGRVVIETIIDPIGTEPSGLSSEAPFIRLKVWRRWDSINSLEVSIGTDHFFRTRQVGRCLDLAEQFPNCDITPDCEQIGQFMINPLGDTKVIGFKTLFGEDLIEGYQVRAIQQMFGKETS